jgi:peptide/nickel transport system substrate-binding protein
MRIESLRRRPVLAVGEEGPSFLSDYPDRAISRTPTGACTTAPEDDKMAVDNSLKVVIDEQILAGIGFKRDSDGVWVDDQGKRMEYELTVPAEYADWSAAAENVAEQLTAFGIKTTVRGVTFTQHPVEVNQGKFQLAIRAWGAGNPHPHFSFVQDFFTHNYVQAAEGKGMNFPLTQTVGDLGELNLEEMVVASAEGLDEASQKETVVKLALAFNQLLPIVPLWERYGNNPTLDGVRVTGWPPEGDPIYKNSPYSDNFVIVMILDGRLHPVAR